MNELVITTYQGKEISALFNDGKMTTVNVINTTSNHEMGSIFVAHIDNIVSNINAAFVRINENTTCYLSLDTAADAIFVKRQSKDRICIGDEIVVQLIKEAMKTKAPVVTGRISITGKYVTIVRSGSGVQVSKKITKKTVKEHLKELLSVYEDEDYCIIARTNSAYADDQEILDEAKQLVKRYRNIREYAVHAVKFTVLYKELPAYLLQLRDTNSFLYDKICTDIPSVYDDVAGYLKHFPLVNEKGAFTQLVLEKDSNMLKIVYKIDHFMELATKRIINLNSGASIVIDQTEALTAIDVNTSKAITGKRINTKMFYEVNVEAAKEIAYQIRLRNLSGIILIDFINMTEKEQEDGLLEELKKYIKPDPVATDLMDITRLGLVELTRRKTYKCLSEQLNSALD